MSGQGATPFGACPVDATRPAHVQLAHGGGGRRSAELVRDVFLAAFGGEVLSRLEDQAVLPMPGPREETPAGTTAAPRPDPVGATPLASLDHDYDHDHDHGRLAFTTDSFVVQPIEFPGGDIGRLAVCGTVNDLAVGGAEPRWIAASFILEEGLALDVLHRIARSMRAACDEASVELVAGDTKVVDRGKGDKVFVTTTGIGWVPPGRSLSVSAARPGDVVLVSGTMGDHGVAILSVREGLAFETALESDCAPLGGLSAALLAAVPDVRAMRDPTRGGLATALNEIAAASRVRIAIDETSVPLRPAVRSACEVLGLDPLYVANEGKLVAIVPAEDAARALDALRAHPLGIDAAVIGEVRADGAGVVTARSSLGGERRLPLLAGEQLPRIC